MYRQKTIAKWLAVILLLTLMIACYLVLNAVLGKKDNVADANNDNVHGAEQLPPADDPPAPPDIAEPTYSVFPRAAANAGGVMLNYVGGDGNECALDSLHFAGKRLIVFDTDSAQYDVKSGGIHIAAFEGAELVNVVHIADGESYVASSLLGSGLAVITKDESRTHIRLYGDDLEFSGENEFEAYSNYGALLDGSQLKLYVSDGANIYALTVSPALNVSKSNFTKQLPSARFDMLASLGDTDILAISNDNGMYMLTFTSNYGFNIKKELLNHRFVQFMPHVGDNLSALYVLSKTDDCLRITSFDYSIGELAHCDMQGANDGVMMPDGNNLTVLTDHGAYAFCAHLDRQLAPALTHDSRFDALFPSMDGLKFRLVKGSDNIFAVTGGANLAIIAVNDGDIVTLFDVAAPLTRFVAAYSSGRLWLALDAEGVMGENGFENADVFLIYLLTEF